jgi:DNA-binding GntR family transcriptional regulator
MTDAVENMEIIIALQTLAIRLACEHASDEQLAQIEQLHASMREYSERHEIVPFFELNNDIHDAIVNASGNSALVAMHEHAELHITRLQKLSGAREADPALAMAEHEAFVSALLRRDAATASAALETHLNTVTEEIKKRISESQVS